MSSQETNQSGPKDEMLNISFATKTGICECLAESKYSMNETAAGIAPCSTREAQ